MKSPEETSSRDGEEKTVHKGASVDRRHFLRTAAVGAGLAGTAASSSFAASSASTIPQMKEPAITRTEAHQVFKDAPIKEFQFPAQGADLFAKVCKDEGLGALFCCPGNYSILSAMANAGIPTYGGRHRRLHVFGGRRIYSCHR